MVTSYILVLCISVWLFTYGLSDVAQRATRLFGPGASVPPALCVMLPLLAFLMVVAAPAPVLVAALLLLLMDSFAVRLPTPWRLGVMAVLCLLAASSVHYPPVAGVPFALILMGAAAGLMALVAAATHLSPQAETLSISTAAFLLPLLVAPFMAAPGAIALDVALSLSALLGGVMALKAPAGMGPARAPLVLITGWMVLEASVHGAWISAALCLGAYGAALAYGLMRSSFVGETHAL